MWCIHIFLHRCVVFPSPQSSKDRFYLRGNISKLAALFKKSYNNTNIFCKCKIILVKLHSHTNHFRAAVRVENGWKTASSSITTVPEAKAYKVYRPMFQTVCLILAPKKHQFILCKANYNKPFQHISDDLTAVRPNCTEYLCTVAGLASWQPEAYKWIGHGDTDAISWKPNTIIRMCSGIICHTASK